MQATQAASYTITLGPDLEVHALIERATGLQSKWFKTLDDLPLRDLTPAAVFVSDAALGAGTDDGGHLIPRLKEAWPASPVILIGGESEGDLLTEGMALGADDFVARPLAADEIGRRFRIRCSALARRAARESVAFGDLTIDTLQRSVTAPRGQKFLSPTEIKLLVELAKAGGNVVPRDALKARCWPTGDVSDNALNRKLYEIRRRLRPITDALNIRTIYGVGFVMEHK